MRIAEHIKGYFFKQILKKRLSGRERKRGACSLLNIKTALVIYNASDENNNKVIESFFQMLGSLNIMVSSIGYAKFKIIPHYCIPRLTKQFICNKDLSLWGIPTNKAVFNDFLDEEHDMLISLDMEQDQVLQYLAAMSKAKCKVGWNHSENLPFYDFLLKGKDDDLVDFIQVINNYLATK